MKINKTDSSSFYAVARGRRSGIFKSWEEAKSQVEGFPQAKHRKFKTRAEAEEYLESNRSNKFPDEKTHAIRPRVEQVVDDERIPSDAIKAFTDGACCNNGKSNASAAFAVIWPEHRAFDYSARLSGKLQTNNRAEYSAVIKCLEVSSLIDPTGTKPLVIYTDSLLLIRTINEWIPNWMRRSWKKSDGGEIANLDLVKRLNDLKKTRPLHLVHVRAHTGGSDWKSFWNDQVDKLAQQACNNVY